MQQQCFVIINHEMRRDVPAESVGGVYLLRFYITARIILQV